MQNSKVVPHYCLTDYVILVPISSKMHENSKNDINLEEQGKRFCT